jgi:hypothetical protein
MLLFDHKRQHDDKTPCFNYVQGVSVESVAAAKEERPRHHQQRSQPHQQQLDQQEQQQQQQQQRPQANISKQPARPLTKIEQQKKVGDIAWPMANLIYDAKHQVHTLPCAITMLAPASLSLMISTISTCI